MCGLVPIDPFVRLFVRAMACAVVIEWALPAAILVVDQAAPGSSDANAGTEDNPFRTIQRAAEIAGPGDTIIVMEGRYVERVKVKTSGAEGQRITLRAVPRRKVVVGGFDVQGSYIRVEGFEITADKPAVAVHLGGSHCEIVDNYIHHMSVGVAGTAGKPGADGNSRDYSAVANNRIAYNKVYRTQYGFMLGGNDWLVENNQVSRLFMYSPGSKYDDCDYSRFFGKGCVQRYNYYHSSISTEIRVAHVDCIQTFTVNGEISQNVLFEYNTCFDFHQMCMVESAPHIGRVADWTLRGNIVSASAPAMSAGWGPDIIQTPNVTIANNTICGVRWATIGLRGLESTNGRIHNNILCRAERAIICGDRDFSAADPVIEHNLTFETSPAPGESNINGKDPLFVDAANRNFRLRKDSPAVRAGKGGLTIGALEYPNVYFVDPLHPAATDAPAWGYPAVPLATLARACEIAEPGETVILRGGVYRETLRPKHNRVAIRAMPGETAVITGADLIEGWKREPDGSWSAPLESHPSRILRDGEPWFGFTYDRGTRRVMVKNHDPRLHQFETVVRKQGIDLVGKNGVTVEGVTVVNVL